MLLQSYYSINSNDLTTIYTYEKQHYTSTLHLYGLVPAFVPVVCTFQQFCVTQLWEKQHDFAYHPSKNARKDFNNTIPFSPNS